MTRTTQEARDRLTQIASLTVTEGAPLSGHTRFGIGGPARLFVETASVEAFVEALQTAQASGLPVMVIGGGTNLIVSDEGFPGIVLRYRGDALEVNGREVTADAGASLQDLVDVTIEHGLAGLHTMTGIPGSVGAAVYGNAGAYGNSISGSVVSVRFYDGRAVRELDNAGCEFHYRESVFKRHKEWIIFSTLLRLTPADRAALRAEADRINAVRNAKYPPTMKCAGSVFKNFLLDELPPEVRERVPSKVVIEGKVPAAYFLDVVGAKGMTRGDMQVADYHANLIYNAGHGSATELRDLIGELKRRVRGEFGVELEEEVQYVGF